MTLAMEPQNPLLKWWNVRMTIFSAEHEIQLLNAWIFVNLFCSFYSFLLGFIHWRLSIRNFFLIEIKGNGNGGLCQWLVNFIEEMAKLEETQRYKDDCSSFLYNQSIIKENEIKFNGNSSMEMYSWLLSCWAVFAVKQCRRSKRIAPEEFN